MTLFAVFGGFATLLFASFGGTRRDKAIAHLGLAVVGSIALIIGTLVSGIAWLAALVTIPVAFAIFFAGVAGPNTASGVTAALLAYVLPVATAGRAGTIPSRLAGWWLASVAGHGGGAAALPTARPATSCGRPPPRRRPRWPGTSTRPWAAPQTRPTGTPRSRPGTS